MLIMSVVIVIHVVNVIVKSQCLNHQTKKKLTRYHLLGALQTHGFNYNLLID